MGNDLKVTLMVSVADFCYHMSVFDWSHHNSVGLCHSFYAHFVLFVGYIHPVDVHILPPFDCILVGCRSFLVVGYTPFVAGYIPSVAGYILLVAGYILLVADYILPVAGYILLVAGYIPLVVLQNLLAVDNCFVDHNFLV